MKNDTDNVISLPEILFGRKAEVAKRLSMLWKEKGGNAAEIARAIAEG